MWLYFWVSVLRGLYVWLHRLTAAFDFSLFITIINYKSYVCISIGPESDHWECLSVTDSLTDSLTHSCLVNFCSDLEHKVWSRFWSWSSARFEAGQFCWIFVRILKLDLVKNLKLMFYGKADVWLRFWSWCLVEILKMFDQDLCKNLWYDLKKLLW